MQSHFIPILLLSLALLGGTPIMAQEYSAQIQKFLNEVGLKPEDGQRGQMDIVGFDASVWQIARDFIVNDF